MSQYGQLSVHRWMLRDTVRNEAFRRSLERFVKPGDVVLDLGAGTGFLSILAAQSGARQVYAVERTDTANLARTMIERNGLGDRIEVIQADIEDASLPEQVDVIVSEWMGGFGVDENILAPLVLARDRWLKPGGTIIPGRVTAFLAPASIPDFDESVAYWNSRPHGVDMRVIGEMTAQEKYHSQVRLNAESLLAEPQAMWTHDPHTCALEVADQPFTAKLDFTATRAGSLSGFVAWFTADMGDGELLTNAVGSPDTHWGRTLFPLDRPITLAVGETFTGELHCDPSLPGSCEFYWSITHAGRLEEHDTRPNRQQRIRAAADR